MGLRSVARWMYRENTCYIIIYNLFIHRMLFLLVKQTYQLSVDQTISLVNHHYQHSRKSFWLFNWSKVTLLQTFWISSTVNVLECNWRGSRRLHLAFVLSSYPSLFRTELSEITWVYILYLSILWVPVVLHMSMKHVCNNAASWYRPGWETSYIEYYLYLYFVIRHYIIRIYVIGRTY